MTRISGSFQRSNFFEACTKSLHSGQYLVTAKEHKQQMNHSLAHSTCVCVCVCVPCVILPECLLLSEELHAVDQVDGPPALLLYLAIRSIVTYMLCHGVVQSSYRHTSKLQALREQHQFTYHCCLEVKVLVLHVCLPLTRNVRLI